jgi:hypothetical protein
MIISLKNYYKIGDRRPSLEKQRRNIKKSEEKLQHILIMTGLTNNNDC